MTESQTVHCTIPSHATHGEHTGPEISALITCYFEERTIETFFAKLSDALRACGKTYEIIMVNDGSSDSTWEKLKSLFETDLHVTAVLDLCKNSGQPAAVTAALGEATGRIILSIDSDLQLDPSEVSKLLAVYDEGYDIVSGKRANRQDSLSRIVPSLIANWIMRRASKTQIRDFGCTFKLYNHTLLKAFGFGPTRGFNPVVVMSATSRIAEVTVSHKPRPHGKSGWTFRKLWNYQMDQIMILIERIFQYFALFAIVLATLLIARIILEWITPFQLMDTVSNGLILNAILVSFLLLVGALSIIGEFTVRSAGMARAYPRYVVREAMRRSAFAFSCRAITIESAESNS